MENVGVKGLALSKATISVAMCTYNGEKYLVEQLNSIATQSTLPDELVICDDGSLDATIRIIGDFAESAPFQVRLFHNGNRLGVAKNFEKAISLCRGQFIALSDQDDIWSREKLTHSIKILEQHSSLGGVFSDAELIDHRSVAIGGQLWASLPFRPKGDQFDREKFVRLLLKQDVLTGATVVFRSEMRDHIMPIPASWLHDAWIAWMLVLYSSLGFIRAPLIKYRIHSSQQVGIASRSVRRRLGGLRLAGNVQYRSLAKKYEDLREKVDTCLIPDRNRYLSYLDRKIQICRVQAELPSHRLKRTIHILCVLPLYMRYTRGVITIFRDLLA